MEKLKAIFKPGKKQPKTTCSPKGDRLGETSSDSTLPSPRPRSSPSPDSPLHDAFPDGVKVLHDRPDAAVDICFIHGLTGNRDSTWTTRGQSTPWLKTLLPLKLTRARILTYGYDAYIVRKSGASSNQLIDHATNLLNDLTTNRASCDALSRPLIFVTHSLGGLVCKEAILLSRNNPEPHLRGLFDYTKGIVFMGTPHRGSWMADWAKIPASALGLAKSTNKLLLEILETDNQLLGSIQIRFLSMIRELREAGRRLEVTCFFEELPMPVVGKIVSKESATLEGYSSFSIHADHRDMVRFSSTDDNGFQRLLGELMRWESQVTGTASSQPVPVEEATVTSSFSNCGTGFQFNTSGGTQNNNTANGNQFPAANFSGPVHFS